MDSPDVSFIIVCMNRMDNLRRLLPSIQKHTLGCTYEVLVTAYLFTPENLAALRREFPWVKVVESNEIRGFSENNNLSLRQSRGRYSFVLNDDTELRQDAASALARRLDGMSRQVAVMSPRVVDGEGNTLVCGRPPMRLRHQLLDWAHLWREHRPSAWAGGQGLFQTYNIVGACFMARRDIFEQVGWLDERYFFSPEDIALSTLLNDRGYECWVDADVEVVHFEGMTSRSASPVQKATQPASVVGARIFFGTSRWRRIAIVGLGMPLMLANMLLHSARSLTAPRPNWASVRAVADWHAFLSLPQRLTPKEVFTRYYRCLKR